jgi:hypothetical protein
MDQQQNGDTQQHAQGPPRVCDYIVDDKDLDDHDQRSDEEEE